MAETVAMQMAKKHSGWVVILAGERHILGRDGIPFRALRRMAAHKTEDLDALNGDVLNRGVFTFLPRTVSFPISAKEAPGMRSADYVWFLQRDPKISFDPSVVNMAPREHLSRLSS